MLGIDQRAARATWTAALVLLLLYVVYLARTTLFIFILALLFAYLLAPLVDLLDRFLPSHRTRTRTPALALAYLIFIAIVATGGTLVGVRVVSQATRLAKDFPIMVDNWKPPTEIEALKEQLVEKVKTEWVSHSATLLESLPQAGMRFLSALSNLVYLVIVPVLAFFFLKDGHVMRQQILDVVDQGPRRELLDGLLADTHLLLAHYMRALVALALAAFAAYSIALSIMGVPYGILLGALAGILEFLPMVGPLAAIAVILLVAAVSGMNVLPVLIFIVAFRMFQDYLLSPHLMERGVELHPLMVLFGVFAGAEIAGIAGTFLSVPVLALVRAVFVRIRKARVEAKLSTGSPIT